MSTNDPSITLYRLQACPFCERVVRVLHDLDLEYRSRFVEPLHSRRNAVKRLTGARTVPAIVDKNTGVTMSESARIVEYLERTYGEGATAETATDRAGGEA
ncbi:glutathione S-transferase N-terminal domain-containing protein [Halorhabdus amylolytica]|uniref:glutathione S-transferase N-terminal domain-containing protein n=1 Tax=Halorhabdus amylolytica TaxID=2559573 RepID=UPI0010AA8C9C|nr:glutathione S-transferase N-terminal domain-containing protein [Halorhabdus amylolytica]